MLYFLVLAAAAAVDVGPGSEWPASPRGAADGDQDDDRHSDEDVRGVHTLGHDHRLLKMVSTSS